MELNSFGSRNPFCFSSLARGDLLAKKAIKEMEMKEISSPFKLLSMGDHIVNARTHIYLFQVDFKLLIWIVVFHFILQSWSWDWRRVDDAADAAT